MPDEPQGPEYYSPPPEVTPPPPPPPSIFEAAAQYDAAQYGTAPATPAPAAPTAYPPPMPAPAPYAYAPPPGAPAQPKGLAITALVLGIIAVISSFSAGVGLVFGVIAVIFGSIALRKRQPKGMSIAGIITGAIGGLISLAMLILLIVLFATTGVNEPYDSDYSYADPASTTLGPEPVDGSLATGQIAFAPMAWDENVSWFVVEIENSGTLAYPSSDFTVEALDASGKVLDSQWAYTTVAPGSTTPLTGVFYELGGAEIDSLRVLGPAPDTAMADLELGEFEVSGVDVSADDWSTIAKGTVMSTSDETQWGPSVTVIARNPAGEIVGYATDYVDELLPGASAPFEAMFNEVLPEETTYEAFVTGY